MLAVLWNILFRFTLVNNRDTFPDCSVVISLTQNTKSRKEEHSIGFRVYKLSPEEDQQPLLGPEFIDNAKNLVQTTGAFINLREVRRETKTEK